MKRRILVSAIILAFLITLFICLGNLSGQNITGETFALGGTAPKSFMYKPVMVYKVYQYRKNGEIIEYKNGKDYYIDYFNGTIVRTTGSCIPDYSAHKVVYNSNGQFSFSTDPRNPELNIEYQVMVDYVTVMSPLRKVKRRKGIEKTIKKLENGENIKIGLCGDSIAAGAQTTGTILF